MSTRSGPGGMDILVALVSGAVVFAFLYPEVNEQLVGADTGSFGGAAQSLWEVFGLVIVLAFFVFVAVLMVRAGRRWGR